jgi:hypothetical protein
MMIGACNANADFLLNLESEFLGANNGRYMIENDRNKKGGKGRLGTRNATKQNNRKKQAENYIS